MQESAGELCWQKGLFLGCLETFGRSWEVSSQSHLSQNRWGFFLNMKFTILNLLEEIEISACKTMCPRSIFFCFLKEVSNKTVKEWHILVMSLVNFRYHTKQKTVLHKILQKISHNLSSDSFLFLVSTRCSCKIFLAHAGCSQEKCFDMCS